MIDAMTIAASGMKAAETSLFASASNIANMQSAGPIPANAPVAQTPGSVYQPVAAFDSPLPEGGVSAKLIPTLPGYTLAYDPSAPFASLDGMVAMPNVDPAAEIVNQMTASFAYKANIATFKTAQSMVKTLLDATA